MLQVANLKAGFDRPVLRGLDLDVPAGEIVSLLGPSGGGKSTLLRCIAGLMPYRGTVVLRGRVVDQLPPHRRGIGMMFQDHLLFPHLDVAGNVGFGLAGSRSGDGRVAEMLGLVGLTGFEGRRVQELSGGEAQRVALARALAPGPGVLLLDEPFGALDAVLKEQIVGQVGELLRQVGVTVVSVTHDRQEAFSLADRVAVLDEGRITRIDPPEQIWADPQQAYVARLLGMTVVAGWAYPPDGIVETEDGPWEAVVRSHSLVGGRLLVHAVGVAGDLTFAAGAASVPAIGTRVRLAPRVGCRLTPAREDDAV